MSLRRGRRKESQRAGAYIQVVLPACPLVIRSMRRAGVGPISADRKKGCASTSRPTRFLSELVNSEFGETGHSRISTRNRLTPAVRPQ